MSRYWKIKGWPCILLAGLILLSPLAVEAGPNGNGKGSKNPFKYVSKLFTKGKKKNTGGETAAAAAAAGPAAMPAAAIYSSANVPFNSDRVEGPGVYSLAPEPATLPDDDYMEIESQRSSNRGVILNQLPSSNDIYGSVDQFNGENREYSRVTEEDFLVARINRWNELQAESDRLRENPGSDMGRYLEIQREMEGYQRAIYGEESMRENRRAPDPRETDRLRELSRRENAEPPRALERE